MGFRAGSASARTPPYPPATRDYDPLRNLYNGSSSSLRKWRTAMARVRSGGAFARINCYGDSITENTPTPTTTWTDRLRALLAADLGAPAAGSGPILLATSGDPRITYAGFAQAGHGPFNTSREANAAGSITFAPGISCDNFQVVYVKGSPWGSFSWQVDGGGATNVNANAGAESYGILNIPVAAGVHTLTLNWVSAFVDIASVEASLGASGVRIGKIARSGAPAAYFSAEVSGADGSFDPWAPELSVILLTANDYNLQTALATYQAQLQAAITSARKTGDVLLVNSVPANYGGAHPILQTDYAAKLYALADSNDVALLDLFARWGSYATGQALSLYGDTVTHPNAAGAYDIATAVRDAISGP